MAGQWAEVEAHGKDGPCVWLRTTSGRRRRSSTDTGTSPRGNGGRNPGVEAAVKRASGRSAGDPRRQRDQAKSRKGLVCSAGSLSPCAEQQPEFA